MYCKYNPVVTSHLTFYVTFSPVVDSFDVNLMPRGQTNLPDVLTVRQQSGSTHREGPRDVSGVSGAAWCQRPQLVALGQRWGAWYVHNKRWTVYLPSYVIGPL